LFVEIGVGTINSNGLLEQFEGHLVSTSLAPATVVNYMADLRAFFRWNEAAREASSQAGPILDGPFELDARDIQSYCSYLQRAKKHVPSTINRRLQALRKFYDFAIQQGWTPANPASDVQLLGEVVSERSRGLTPDDVARLMAVVRKSRARRADRDWAIFQVLLHAGLKLSELTQLRLADLELGAVPPCLRVYNNSSGPSRTIPLEGEVCDALRAYLSKRQAAPGVDYVFLNRDGNPLSTRTVQRLLHQYARAAALDNLTTQSLRYVYATRVYEESGDPKTVARLLGHRHLATTIRYLRSSGAQQTQIDTDNPDGT
jgi:site-specific recombinase XerD